MDGKLPIKSFNLSDYNVGSNNFVNSGYLFMKWLLENQKLEELASRPAFIRLGIGNADVAIGNFERGSRQYIEYAVVIVLSYNNGIHLILKNGPELPITIRQL